MRSVPALIILLSMAAATLVLRAQHQVNPMVNNTANRAVYGGVQSGSVKYAGVNPSVAARTSQVTQSEWRHAYWQSGATPSSVRMGYNALGPRAEGGAMAYIHHSPDYLKPKKQALPAASGSAAYSPTGSIKYNKSTPAPTSAMISAPALNALIGAPKPVYPTLTHTPVKSVPLTTSNTGSVRYTQ